METEDVLAVVLCGGESRRFGSDKTAAELAGRPVLDHVLDGLPTQWPVVCVGPARPTTREVTWTREDPPGGGPAAGIAAALALLTPGSRYSPTDIGSPNTSTGQTRYLVAVVGGDMPYAGSALPALVTELRGHSDLDAVVARDGEGRPQPLLAAYRIDALRAALGDEPAGTPLMRVLDALRLRTVAVEGDAASDVDTPADLQRLRHRLAP